MRPQDALAVAGRGRSKLHGSATAFISPLLVPPSRYASMLGIAVRLSRCYEASMDRDAAIAQIRKACNGISIELMKINPAVSALGHKEAQDEIYRVVFELTKEVETIKKRLAKLERSDESRDL
jgi:hypothetical protein